MNTRATTLLLGLALAAAPVGAHAQARCVARVAGAASAWQAPLGRTITLHAGDVPLRDALARVESAARIRISYSTEALPVDRRVCLEYDGVAVGAALAAMLAGTSVQAVVAGTDHIVLAPRSAMPARERADDMPEVVQHEPVIASTSIRHTEQTAPTSATIVAGETLARSGARTLAQALNGSVPGLWLWQSSSGPLAHYGSMRGASSFGSSAPKVYIDGIELANPLLLNRLSVDAIDRIEVIRGPQGAALHGANAIGGVLNIITRHDAATSGAPRVTLQTGVGVASSDFTSGSALAQDHALALRAASASRSLGINLSLGSIGEFAPDASGRHFAGEASGRLLGARTIVTGTLRFLNERADAALNPIVSDSLADARLRLAGLTTAALTGPHGVRQLTGGVNASFQPNERWAHTLVAGVDGYALDGGSAAASPQERTSAGPHAGTPRVAFSGGTETVEDVTAAWRGTLRLSSSRALDMGDVGAGRITLSAEHSLLRQREGDLEQTRTNTGLSAQTEVAIRQRLFLTAGVRFEHDGGLTSALRAAALPMLGASYVMHDGNAHVKLRAAYGKAIRWPELPAIERMRDPLRAAFRSLAIGPEQQSGIEAGVDVSFGNTLALQLTRFDQTAIGLAQTDAPATGDSDDTDRPRLAAQSVGQIDNRGWELQASLSRGPISLTGTASLVDSRVRALSAAYTGDLQPGDRMLGVPARTLSLTASWNGAQTFASLTVARAADWVHYDLIALATADTIAWAAGAPLREYWRDYRGVTHLRAALARELGRGLSLTLTGDNLLDAQLGEPDNITIVPGRTLSLGLRAAF